MHLLLDVGFGTRIILLLYICGEIAVTVLDNGCTKIHGSGFLNVFLLSYVVDLPRQYQNIVLKTNTAV